MSHDEHPYRRLADIAFWRRAVAALPREAVDPTGEFKLRLTPQTRVATAGSCFAQHIARHLSASGYNYYVVERAHPLVSKVEKEHCYGTFSARYGNIYTSRQLLQLIRRAYGKFRPEQDAWIESTGRVLDPFRPTIQPGGFGSVVEMHADRRQHLAAVRRMFETLDVFIFTLGLTECWQSRVDGAVFPLCPGVEGGVFDPTSHSFLNLSAGEVVADLQAFIAELRTVNPASQLVFTVSPVPLVATAQPGAHVLAATTYSKSVLRVAAEEICRATDAAYYFPSYEIITGAYARGAYYAKDLRNVTEDGVEHVMRTFLRHATGREAGRAARSPAVEPVDDGFMTEAERLVETECDELVIERVFK